MARGGERGIGLFEESWALGWWTVCLLLLLGHVLGKALLRLKIVNVRR